jgi:hypothetical protein
MRQPFVRRQVLTRRVGVDRHLSRLASADRRYEIQGDHAALLASQLQSGIGDTYFHDPDSRSHRPARSRPGPHQDNNLEAVYSQ